MHMQMIFNCIILYQLMNCFDECVSVGISAVHESMSQNRVYLLM